jgi:hypothetical protein
VRAGGAAAWQTDLLAEPLWEAYGVAAGGHATATTADGLSAAARCSASLRARFDGIANSTSSSTTMTVSTFSARGPEPVDDLLDQHLGRGRTGGQPDGADAVEPGLVDLRRVVDQVGGDDRSALTSTSRLEFDDVCEPTTRTRSQRSRAA